MDSDRDYLEENTARLIRAGLGSRARPDPKVGEEMLRRMRGEVLACRTSIGFPNGVLVALAGVLLLMAAWLAIHTAAGQPIMASTTLTITAAVLALNLSSVPVASLIIVIRRHHA